MESHVPYVKVFGADDFKPYIRKDWASTVLLGSALGWRVAKRETWHCGCIYSPGEVVSQTLVTSDEEAKWIRYFKIYTQFFATTLDLNITVLITTFLIPSHGIPLSTWQKAWTHDSNALVQA